MQEQAAKLSEQEKNEVARQMQEAAQAGQNGQAQLSARAMQRLAELMRQAGKNGGQRQASNAAGAKGGPMSEQQMQDLLNALENMKDGLQPGGEGQTPGLPTDGQEGGKSLALVESFAKKNGGDAQNGQQPAGMPGSERDPGTNDHLLAEHAADAQKSEGPSKRLEGMLGDGASLQELVGATANPARAGRGLSQSLRSDCARRTKQRGTGEHSAGFSVFRAAVFREYPTSKLIRARYNRIPCQKALSS